MTSRRRRARSRPRGGASRFSASRSPRRRPPPRPRAVICVVYGDALRGLAPLLRTAGLAGRLRPAGQRAIRLRRPGRPRLGRRGPGQAATRDHRDRSAFIADEAGRAALAAVCRQASAAGCCRWSWSATGRRSSRGISSPRCLRYTRPRPGRCRRNRRARPRAAWNRLMNSFPLSRVLVAEAGTQYLRHRSSRVPVSTLAGPTPRLGQPDGPDGPPRRKIHKGCECLM